MPAAKFAIIRNCKVCGAPFQAKTIDFDITWDDGRKITQEQWIAILKENGIEVSIATFKRYLNDRGYSKRRSSKKVSLPKQI